MTSLNFTCGVMAGCAVYYIPLRVVGAPVNLVSIGRLPSGVMVRPGSGSGNTPGSQPQQPPLAPYGAICRQVRSYLSAHRYTIPAPAPCGCIPNSLPVLRCHHYLVTFRRDPAARGHTHLTHIISESSSLRDVSHFMAFGV